MPRSIGLKSDGRTSFGLFLIALGLLVFVLSCSLPRPNANATATAAAYGTAMSPGPSVTAEAAVPTVNPKGGPTSEPAPTDTPIVAEPLRVVVAADGGGASDFATLAEAVDELPAGSTIELTAGTYALDETLLIEQALTLVGAGMDETEIVGTASDAVIAYGGPGAFTLQDLSVKREGDQPGDVVQVRAGEATLLRVRASGAIIGEDDDPAYAGIRFLGDGVGEATDCEVFGNAGHGLRVAEQATVDIVNAVASTNGIHGITFTDDSTGSVIASASTANAYSGIGVLERAQVEITDCSLDGNTQSGLVYFGAGGGTASNNMMMNNGLHGISVNDDAAPLLEANTCSNNTEDGIVFFDRAVGTALDNTCSENGLHGIGVADEAAPLLEGNTVSNNTEVGIRFSQSATGTARGNMCFENGLSGIVVTNGAAPEVISNVVRDNSESGLGYFEAGGGVATKNTLSGNALHGIDMYGSAAPLLEENDIYDNAEAGVRISGEAAPQILNNIIQGSGLSGVIVRESASPTIEDNVVEGNVECGLIFFHTSGGVARRNVIVANQSNGISVRDEAQPVLQDNVMEDNAESGLAYFDTSGGVAQVNAITGSKWGIYVADTARPALGEHTFSNNETDLDDRRPVDARPTPPPYQPGDEAGVLFVDDFTWPDPGWSSYDGDAGEVWFEEGEMRMLNWTASDKAPVTTAGQWLDDAVITVESRHVEGTLDNWHDVMCRRQDAQNYYLAGYSADGYVMMRAQIAGEPVTFLDIVTSPLVNQGNGATNDIELTCVGDTVRFSLNGSLVGEFTDDTLAEGDIGFSVSSLDGEFSTIAFDNLVVREP